ncbi:unnamed protein product [Adineta steineri]|uniref:ADP ribosyltransferase domain-containing protein n=1 Tax=Adineta steineri TaxID=433720 RepID=A0A814T7P7_9BILA|nr:unnamed protein product [Adineta steineri]CAF1268672.1 unnamed protein product [Adineta steineri]CAF1487100.1 unnamed protein product [Adineta steineri]
MDKGESTTNACTVPKGAEDPQPISLQHMQNVLLIWLDSNVDKNNEDCQNTITQLRRAVNDINIYTDVDQCLEFIQTIIDKKVCMIIPGYFGQHIVPRVHNMPGVDSIFVLCGSKERHEQWVKNWPKIKGVFTDIKQICEALKSTAQQCDQNNMPMSFVGSNKNLDQLDPPFMYTQILKEIILTISFDQKHIQDYLDYCRNIFTDNEKEMININSLKDEYHKNTPVYWYTCDMFLYRMLNSALRMMDGDIITRMGFFISDLHRQIEQLYQEQYAGTTDANTFTIFRGQVLSSGDLKKMMENKGGLISFNSFLSTSKDRSTSLNFVQNATINSDQIRVLFIMEINPAQSTTPFASIAGISDFEGEKEVLFSMLSVFRIKDIKHTDENNRLYEVSLVLTADNDPELSRLTDYIRKESFPDAEGWYRLGLVLWKMGQLDRAEDIYQVLLDQTTDDKERALIYHRLGCIKGDQGKYQEALTFYKESFDIRQKILTPDHLDLAMSYNNIGNVHINMSNYPQALSCHEKALEIRQQSLLPNHPDLAMSYNNIGLVHNNMRNYPKALASHEQALGIQQSLPSNHPDIAKSYISMGLVHSNMGDYPEALSYYEKALKIQQQSLPSNHPDLAKSYISMGLVHSNMSNYPQALSSHKKAFEIQQQSLLPNHPDLAMSYNNIGLVHNSMRNYPQALASHEKALEIRQQSVLPNHFDLGSSYNNIGAVYGNMGNHSKARTFFERAVQIAQQSLRPNDPNLHQWRKNLKHVKNK